MPKFRLSAEITVSAYTTVTAATLVEAIEEAKDRSAVIGGMNSGESEDENWIVDEADGEATNIHAMDC